MAIREKITWADLGACKRAGRKFSVLTCYDASMARLMEQAGVEVLLVGDTAAEVILGFGSTREIEPEFLLMLTAAVGRGAPRTCLMADLPYACRAGGDQEAVRWARRFVDEAGADAVKIEVTAGEADLVESAVAAGVLVIAHIGLLPQRVDPRQGYRAQGKDAQSALKLIEEAKLLENAGAGGLLLEAVTTEVAQEITIHTSLPVIGCVAGPHCDGTVVVLHDLIGLEGGHAPRKVKQYANLSRPLSDAFAHYVQDIQAGRFPCEPEAIHMNPGELDKLLAHTSDA